MARPPTPHDWTALRREYIEGAASYAQFAREHDLYPTTVQERAKREGWEAARQEYRAAIASRALKASQDAAVRDAAAIRKRHHQIAGNLVVRIGQKVLEGKAKPSDLNLLAQALQRAADVELVSGGHPLTPAKLEVAHSGSIGGTPERQLADLIAMLQARAAERQRGAEVVEAQPVEPEPQK